MQGGNKSATSLRDKLLCQRPFLPVPQSFPEPSGWSDPDRDMTKTASLVGVPGTFNYLSGEGGLRPSCRLWLSLCCARQAVELKSWHILECLQTRFSMSRPPEACTCGGFELWSTPCSSAGESLRCSSNLMPFRPSCSFSSFLLSQAANETYHRIKDLADMDAKKWNSGIDAHKGFLQITKEFIPTRIKQLTKLVFWGAQGNARRGG